jgi:DNA-binding CsgD family transcriptional regulator
VLLLNKRVFLYGGIIGLAFLWTGSAFISLAYRLMESYTSSQIDIYQVIVGYLLQVLGMAIFVLGVRSYPRIFMKRLFFAAVMVMEAVIITAGILSSSAPVSLFFSFSMNLLHGVVAGCYLIQLSAFIPQQYRGRVFGFGYAIGSVGSWLLSLPFGGTFLKMDGIVIVYLILISLTILLNSKVEYGQLIIEDASPQGSFDTKSLVLMFMVLVLLSLAKTVGFYFPASDISGVINLEFSRAFYALGLVAAGIINDKNRRYGAICSVAALVFSFISFALEGKTAYTLAIWILGYIFFGFFSVYRVVVFSDIAAKKSSLLPLAVCGLMAGRIGDAFGTLAGMLLSGNTIPLLVVTSGLFILVVFMFFSQYQKLYNPVLSESENIEKLHEAFAEKYALTMRESEVLRLIVQGYSNLEISGALYVSESTVKFHVGNILKKSGCSNRVALTMLFKNKAAYF